MNTTTGATPENLVEVEPNIFEPLATLVTLKSDNRLARRANSYLAMVNSFTIGTRDDYAMAAEELATVKRAWKGGEAERTEVSGLLNLVLDKWNAKFMPSLRMLKLCEEAWKTKMLGFDTEQERIAAVRAREAERLADLERKRLAAEAAEVERLAQAERTRLAAIETERLRKANEEQARINEQVRAAQAAGNAAAAAAAHSQAVALAEQNANAAIAAEQAAQQVAHAAAVEVNAIQQHAAVVVAAPQAAPAQVAGLSTAKGWDYEVTDLQAAVRDIVLNKPQFISLLLFDTVKMRAQVKALGNNLILDGVRVFDKRTLRQAGKP